MILPKNIADLPNDLRSVVAMIDAMFDEVYLVGGAVRDILLNKSTLDLDFATPSSVQEIKSILQSNHLLSMHLEGEQYGTVSATIGNFGIQITTFRSENYEHGSRKPHVGKAIDIDSDLSRRDFTINALALSRDELIDPYDGIGSIDRKEIIVVGDPDTKFREDPLRILRAFRLVSELGFNLDDTTLQACIRNKEALHFVSTERIGGEFQKIIKGQYWDDGFVELAESKVLNVILDCFGLSYGVSPNDVYFKFSDFTAEQLRNMPLTERWHLIIQIIDHGREVAGVESVDALTIAEKILTYAQINKLYKKEILEYIGIQERKKTRENSEARDLDAESLYTQAVSQKESNDPRWMINMATYYTLLGKSAFRDGQYSLAVNKLKESIDISQLNQSYIIDVYQNRPADKQEKMKGLMKWLKDRVKYYILAVIFAEKLYSKFDKTEDLIAYIHKAYRYNGISSAEMYIMIEQAVASVYKRSPHGITLEPFLDYLANNNLHLGVDDVIRYKRTFIESRIRDDSIPSNEKAPLYLEKANLSIDGRDKSERGFEYYDPYVDYLYNMMISSDSLDEFNAYYDEFVHIADSYLELSSRWGKFKDGKRNMYLTSASALTYAIQISKSLEERIKLSTRLVEDYEEGREFRNAKRYQIYGDWFSLVKLLLELDLTGGVPFEDLVTKIGSLDSVTYEDEDEGYLTQYRPDLVSKRNLLRDVYLFIVVASGRKHSAIDKQIKNDVIKSLSILTNEAAIDKKSVFTILKNYIARIEREIESIDLVKVPDRILAKRNSYEELDALLTGESEIIEYKSSWSFDLKPYLLSEGKSKKNNNELKREVVKNIAGMMNKNGGTILVGVEDDARICGLENTDFILQSSPDHKKKLDNILLNMKDEISNRLSKEVLASVSMDAMKDARGDEPRTIIRIKVPKFTHDPVLYKEDDQEVYYVRSGTSTNNAGMRAYADALYQSRLLLQPA